MSLVHISEAVSEVAHVLHLEAAREKLAKRYLPEAFVHLVEATQSDFSTATGEDVRIPMGEAFPALFRPATCRMTYDVVLDDGLVSGLVDCPSCGGLGVFDDEITSYNPGSFESVSWTSRDVECGTCEGRCQIPADQVAS